MSAEVVPFPAHRIVNESYRTKRQIAEHYGLSTRTVDRKVEEGMPFEYIGGRRRFKLSEVDAWLRKR